MSEATSQLRWRGLSDGGLEHCALKTGPAGITAEGVVIGGAGETSHALRYRIVVEPEWAGIRSVHLTLLGGPTVALRHDGYGGWTDGEGKIRKDLAGALDLDLGASPIPLAVTLKRQSWKSGKSQEFDVVHIVTPGFAVSKARLRVACVEPGRAYRIGPEDGAAEVLVAEDGIPQAWSGRFERV